MGGKIRGKGAAICPYYCKDYADRIICEGHVDGVRVQTIFGSVDRKVAYMEDFCLCRCWQGCPVAGNAEEKYKE